MAERRWTCPDCETVGISDPERLPPTEFIDDQLEAVHQWARFFDRQSGAETYTAVDFVHWLLMNHRVHSHETRRNEPAGRPGRVRLEARSTAA